MQAVMFEQEQSRQSHSIQITSPELQGSWGSTYLRIYGEDENRGSISSNRLTGS